MNCMMNPESEIVNIRKDVAKTKIFEASHRGMEFGRANSVDACADQGGLIKKANRIAQVGKQSQTPGHTKRPKRGGGYIYIYMYRYVYINTCIDVHISV